MLDPPTRSGFSPSAVHSTIEAVIEFHIIVTKHLGQDKPVGRRPVTGIAVADDRQLRVEIAIDRVQLGDALQPVGVHIIGVFLEDQLGPGNTSARDGLRMLGIAKELLLVRPSRRVAPAPASTIRRTSSVVT